MRALNYLRVETARILKSRVTWLAFTAVFIGLILNFAPMERNGTTMASLYLAGQINSASIAGAVILAFLTLYELNRAHKSNMDAITDCVISPLTRNITLILSLAFAAMLMALFSPEFTWCCHPTRRLVRITTLNMSFVRHPAITPVESKLACAMARCNLFPIP